MNYVQQITKRGDMSNFIIRKIEELAVNSPNRVAIQDSTNYITYEQLWQRISEISNIISEYTLGKSIPIIVYQDRKVSFIVSMLAILKANCCYIPVVKDTPATRIKYIIEDVNCKLALVDEKIEYNGLMQYNICDGSLFNEYVVQDHSILSNRCKNIAYVMYTSGTTGKPKGVKISISNLQNLVESFWEILYGEISENVCVAVLASFGFDSSVKQIYCSLYYGHTLVIASNKDKKFSKTLQDFYKKNNIYISDGTPSNLKILLLTKKTICNNVKYYIIGGENFPSDTARKMFEKNENDINLINVYGPTECCVDVSYYKVNKNNIPDGYLPIGKPILNTKMLIYDLNGNIIKNLNTKGELVIVGKSVGDGYTSADNSCFIFGKNIFDNYYYTGDLAMYNSKNDIVILGRKDNQIKKNGYRIELDEVATQIKYIEIIRDVVVRKVNISGIDKIVAYIVCSKKNKEDIIKEELALKLPKYMLPDIIIQMEEMPLNINTKVDEELLKAYVRTIVE